MGKQHFFSHVERKLYLGRYRVTEFIQSLPQSNQLKTTGQPVKITTLKNELCNDLTKN